MDIEDFKTSRFNIFGAGTNIKGELHLTGRSSICGDVEGKLIASEDSLLVIEKTSMVKGEIHAYDIEIHGKFEGKLVAKGTLSLKPGCDVTGEIQAARLVIYPGAQLNSQCEAGL